MHAQNHSSRHCIGNFDAVNLDWHTNLRDVKNFGQVGESREELTRGIPCCDCRIIHQETWGVASATNLRSPVR